MSRSLRRLGLTRLGWAVVLGLVLMALVTAARVGADEWGLAPTVTPAPTHTAVPEPTEEPRYAPASRGGRSAVEELAAAAFPPQHVAWAVRTAGCESGWNLYAHSAGYDRRLGVYYDFWGALQVDAVTWAEKAWELFGGPLSEPTVNFAMAAWILDHHGRSAWPICGFR